jgi:hypothetical protein
LSTGITIDAGGIDKKLPSTFVFNRLERLAIIRSLSGLKSRPEKCPCHFTLNKKDVEFEMEV